ELLRVVTHDGYSVGERVLEIRFHAVGSAPDAVSVGGRSLSPLDAEEDGGEGYLYDAERRILAVRIREVGERQSVTVRSTLP
ncbi:MAG: hypothetical protein ACRDSE_23685, partial [Pseudonocardiaceae bacterium]